jgi:hypothetical protein
MTVKVSSAKPVEFGFRCEHESADCAEGVFEIFLSGSVQKVHVCPFHYSVFNI